MEHDKTSALAANAGNYEASLHLSKTSVEGKGVGRSIWGAKTLKEGELLLKPPDIKISLN